MMLDAPRRDVIAHSAPTIDASDLEAVIRQLESGWIAGGEATGRFAEALRDYAHAESATVTSSGTSGLALALLALGVGTGDEVIVPSYLCHSVVEAVRTVGATPVLCDIGDDWMLHPEAVARVRTDRTRVIVAVSIFGLACDLDALGTLGIPIVDDRCQAFGLPRPAQPLVAYSVCSFHATKCLATGEGGAVLSWSTEASARLRASARTYRRSFGVFSDLQAALGLAQLAAFPARLQRRRDMAERYLRTLPTSATDALRSAAARGSVWFRVPIQLPHGRTFEQAQAAFLAEGVHVRRGVDTLLHRAAGLPDERFRGAAAAFDRTLSLPIWPHLTDAQLSHVLEVGARVLA